MHATGIGLVSLEGTLVSVLSIATPEFGRYWHMGRALHGILPQVLGELPISLVWMAVKEPNRTQKHLLSLTYFSRLYCARPRLVVTTSLFLLLVASLLLVGVRSPRTHVRSVILVGEMLGLRRLSLAPPFRLALLVEAEDNSWHSSSQEVVNIWEVFESRLP